MALYTPAYEKGGRASVLPNDFGELSLAEPRRRESLPVNTFFPSVSVLY